MIKVGFAGFAKSFLAWTLAGVTKDGVIYADSRAPYRRWNKTVAVYESWAEVKSQKTQIVYMDHAEPEEFPDVVVYGVLPDPIRVEIALLGTLNQQRKTFYILLGYEENTGMWPFQQNFQPTIILPWDIRHATSVMLGIPLSLRDPAIGRLFNVLVEGIKKCG